MSFFLGFIILAGLAAFLWSFFEARRFGINPYSVVLKKNLLQPLKILHLSDIHFSGNYPALSRFFDRLAETKYDFIFITGDIFDCAEGIPEAVTNLRKLSSIHGVYAVFGNHDYYDYRLIDIATMGFRGRTHPKTLQPSDRLKQTLEDAGVRLLVNEETELCLGKQKIVIHGLDDPTTGRADIERAMKNDDPSKIHILLTHTIDAFFYIGEGEVDLSFSGHSHGGQIRFPGIGALITHTRYGPDYAEGIKYLKDAVCCVSRGVGASRHFSLRLLCPPEAVVLNVSGPA